MHILILPSWYFPAGTDEIAGRMFHQHALALREQGIDARILYIQSSPKKYFLRKMSWQIEEHVPTYRVNRWFPPKMNSLIFSLWLRMCAREIRAYIRLHGTPDLIHAQSYMTACMCVELQKKINIPFIYTERLSRFIQEEIPLHHFPFIQNSLSRAAASTCVSPGLMQALKKHTSKAIIVIPNFVETAVFYPDTTVPKNHSFTFVTVGEPAHVKGLDLLFHAFAGLKEKFPHQGMRLMLIDRIPEKGVLINLAKALGIENDLIWTGLISQKVLVQTLRQCHVMVSASRVETFGKAMVEAQACGLPLVATKTDGAIFILQSSLQGELAEKENINSLQEAMSKVYSGYRHYDARQIHDLVKLRFGKQTVMQEWMRVYQSVRP